MPQSLSGSAGNINANGAYNPNTYSINASNTTGIIGGYGYGTISITPARSAFSVKWVGDDLKMVFAAEENDVQLNLELVAERDISPLEQLHLQQLISSFSAGSTASPALVMSYVRKHHLERHFKISAA